MENPIAGTMHVAKKDIGAVEDAAMDVMGSTRDTMEDVKDEVEHRASRAYSALMNGARLAMGLGALARYLDTRHMMRWIGIGRRRTALGTMALLGAGAAVGAGFAMFLSPASGEETRRGFMRSFQKIGRKGKDLLETAESEVRELGSEVKAGVTREGGKQKGEEGGKQKGEARPEGGSTSAQTPGNANRGEGSKSYHT